MGLDFLVPIFGILIVLVPITGITAVLTLRHGLKPLLDDWVRHQGELASPMLERRIQELSDQVESLTGEVRALREARSFDEALLRSRDRPVIPPGPAPDDG